MILIPDKNVPKDSLHAPAKLWGIEIAQDVQSPEQYFAGKNEKMLKEGEKIIIYTVEYPEQVGKRAIRLVPKKDFDKDKDRWSNVYLYQDGERFQNPAAPMDVMISRNDDGSFYLDVQVK